MLSTVKNKNTANLTRNILSQKLISYNLYILTEEDSETVHAMSHGK